MESTPVAMVTLDEGGYMAVTIWPPLPGAGAEVD